MSSQWVNEFPRVVEGHNEFPGAWIVPDGVGEFPDRDDCGGFGAISRKLRFFCLKWSKIVNFAKNGQKSIKIDIFVKKMKISKINKY
jgi:hypothetical protein